jgi:uncharacterized protein YcbK (DUF882 family)
MTSAQQLEQFIDRLGLRHFSGSEFTPYWSRSCSRNGVAVRNKVPSDALWPNIIKTLIVLDELREELGVPIKLTSTYRAPVYNGCIGGEPASFHMQFRAIDFVAQGKTPAQVAAKLRSWRGKSFALPGNGGAFTFAGGVGKYPSFVHVDTRGYNADW